MNNNPETIYQNRCWNSYFENVYQQKRWPTIRDFFSPFCSLNSLQLKKLLLWKCFLQPQSPSGCCSHLLWSWAQAQHWGAAQLFQLKSKHNREPRTASCERWAAVLHIFQLFQQWPQLQKWDVLNRAAPSVWGITQHKTQGSSTGCVYFQAV